MGKTILTRRVGLLFVLAIALAALALSASLVTTNAKALPTFTNGSGSIPSCESCHSQTSVHGVAAHGSFFATCSNCHVNGDTTVPPTPAKCGVCHGHVSVILTSATHVATKCGSTAGCHGVPLPSITSFAPSVGPVGTVVTLNGHGFTGVTAVAFNGVAASTVTVVSDARISATVPVGATTGKITVTPLSGPVMTSATDFTVGTATVTPKITIKSAASVKVKKPIKISGMVTPTSLAGRSVKVTIQKKSGAKWKTVKTASATVTVAGAYSYKYKPSKKGTYRAKGAIAAKAGVNTATSSVWKTFKVK